MRKEIKLTIIVFIVLILLIALIKPKIDYYLREGDVITIRINMDKVEHALESFYIESSGRYPESLDEKNEETDEKFLEFLLKEDWYEPPVFPLWRDKNSPIKRRTLFMRENWFKPIKKREFRKVVKFKPLVDDNVPEKIIPCRIYIYTDGVRYKIIGGDKRGFLIPKDSSYERGTSKPKVIYSDNYWYGREQ